MPAGVVMPRRRQGTSSGQGRALDALDSVSSGTPEWRASSGLPAGCDHDVTMPGDLHGNGEVGRRNTSGDEMSPLGAHLGTCREARSGHA